MFAALIGRLAGFGRDRRGSVSPMLTLLMIPIIGALGMATEASSWYFAKRAMQNAADSAAIAAATNACASGQSCDQTYPFYNVEAASVAAKFGFQNGVSDTTVVAANNVTCPNGDTNCYKVTITRKLPIYLTRVVGFAGDTTTTSGMPAQLAKAEAIASPRGQNSPYCMIALGSGNSFTINGGPNVNLAGCNLYGNGNLKCNGANSDTGVDYGYAVGTSNCGANKVGSNPTLTDPYSYLNANPPIPTNTCGSYPQGGSGPTLSNADPWGSLTVKKCGDTRLTADINVTNANTVLVVYNGYLDLNGHTLKTTGSGSLTVILSGTVQNGGSTTYNHIVKNSTGSGTLDIAGPTSGTLSGVALYQDKRLTGSKNAVDMTYNGNDPTLMIQGLVYMPNSNFTMKGAINLHSGGNRCIAVVAKTILVSGQGAVFGNPTSQCSQSGLAVPGVPGTAARQALVR